MYFSIAKFSFEGGPSQYDQRVLRSLCDKIRSRFQVCLKIQKGSIQTPPSLVISLLENSRQKIDQNLDQIASLCEESGLGRLSNEQAFYDHIDNFFEQET